MKLRLLLLSLFALVIPVFAQDPIVSHTLTDEEMALVEEIQAAYDRFATYPAIGIDLNQVVDQLIVFEGGEMTQEIAMQMEIEMLMDDGQVVAFSALNGQTLDSNMLSGVLVMEMIYIDEELYINITETDGVYSGLFASGWGRASENPILQDTVGLINQETLNQLNVHFSPEFVEAIALVAEDDLVDAERAIYVNLHPQALREQGFLDEFAQQTFQEEAEDFDAIFTALLEDAEMELVYNFDADGLLTRVDLVMFFEGDLGVLLGDAGFLLTQDHTQTAFYRYYDEPITITAPEID